MTKSLFIDFLGWGIGLWLIGYLLGIILFAFVPAAMIGWVIMPIGAAVTIWVLLKKISGTGLSFYFWLGTVWMLIAVVLDYFLLVKVFKPADGYYKLDVYLYYLLTILLPIIVGWRKVRSSE